jgi:hypothetical protein
VRCSAEHLDKTGSDRTADTLRNGEIDNMYSSPHIRGGADKSLA